jgi:hypothetical protein
LTINKFTNVSLLLAFLSFGLWPARDVSGEIYVVGAESIDYYPHYHFDDEKDKGYAWAVLEEFAKESGHVFKYEAYPIKRLRRELLTKKIDFLYPDNPKWNTQQQKQSGKIFSLALVTAIGSTMVATTRLRTGINNFKSLSVPRGFTPIKWTSLISQNRVHIVEVSDALAALRMVIIGRVDGADVEYNVATHLLRELGQQQTLKFDPSLPHDPVTFHLSSIEQETIKLQFNQFILNHGEQLHQLKQHYNIIEPHQLPSPSSSTEH